MKNLVKIYNWLGKNFLDILKILAAFLVAFVILRDDAKELNFLTNSKNEIQIQHHIDSTGYRQKPYETTTPYGYGLDKPQKITWSGLQGGEEGMAIRVANWPKKSVSVTGSWAGVSAIILGSNDGVNYFILSTEQGEKLFFTSNALKTIGPNTLYIKPKVLGKTIGNIKVDLVLTK
jgi:hypothetical protein